MSSWNKRQDGCHPQTAHVAPPEQKWDGRGLQDDSDDRWGELALPGAAAYLRWWFSCSLSVAAGVTVVMGVSLPVEFGATLVDCFLAQLVRIGTVAPGPCYTAVWGNGPTGNCKTVPPAPLVLAASQSFSTTSWQQPHCLFLALCSAKTS